MSSFFIVSRLGGISRVVYFIKKYKEHKDHLFIEELKTNCVRSYYVSFKFEG